MWPHDRTSELGRLHDLASGWLGQLILVQLGLAGILYLVLGRRRVIVHLGAACVVGWLVTIASTRLHTHATREDVVFPRRTMETTRVERGGWPAYFVETHREGDSDPVRHEASVNRALDTWFWIGMAGFALGSRGGSELTAPTPARGSARRGGASCT